MRKKKIAVVTWAGANNYGTVLQGFSLVQILEKSGYDAYLYTKYRKYGNPIKRLLKSLLIGVGFKQFEDKNIDKIKRVKKFRKKYEHEIEYNKLCSFFSSKHFFDVFVTGSDQIWNTQFRYDPFYFLDFAGKHKRIAYSSSIGTKSVNEKYKLEVRSHLLKFAHISVREGVAVEVLSNLTGRTDIKHVLDPVFLITSNEWKQYCCYAPLTHKSLPRKYIMCYFVGQNDWYHDSLEDVKSKYGIDTIINVSAHYNPRFIHPKSELYNEGHPFDFIYLISQATVVCTDSFHATSLSIIMSKDFVLLKRFAESDSLSQNSRVIELLERFNLNYKLYSQTSKDWLLPIDYALVQNKLERERKACLNYLIQSIES